VISHTALFRARSTRAAALLLLALTGYCTVAAAQGLTTVPGQAQASGQAQGQLSTPAASPAARQSAAGMTPAVNGMPASADDIRDIRGPKPLDAGWLAPLVAVAILLAAAYGAWLWHKRRRRPYVRTAFEIARDRLERARELMQHARGREFSIEVSSTVREYIENRFRVMAAHRTTDEFLRDLLESTDPVLAANRTLLSQFLAACDLAKFGGFNLSMPTMEALLQSAHRFVALSAPSESAKSQASAAQPPATRASYDSLRTT
jgi:hypothetical protein